MQKCHYSNHSIKNLKQNNWGRESGERPPLISTVQGENSGLILQKYRLRFLEIQGTLDYFKERSASKSNKAFGLARGLFYGRKCGIAIQPLIAEDSHHAASL